MSIADCSIDGTPVAVIDVETTGLTPGFDRIVELSVVRVEPDGSTSLVLDTLVNPRRRMAATEVHGITDADVQDAPAFSEIAGNLLAATQGCVVASYNVYFDIRFLAQELAEVRVAHQAPHFCLMYMRPMLGLGPRCKLAEACRAMDVPYRETHVASDDAMAASQLYVLYRKALTAAGVRTFGEMARLRKYKFAESFVNMPWPGPSAFALSPCRRLQSRVITAELIDPVRMALSEYWDALKTVLADLEITDEEMVYMQAEQARLNLQEDQVRVLHARAFANVIAQVTADRVVDDRECRVLRRLRECLSKLGWAPGD